MTLLGFLSLHSLWAIVRYAPVTYLQIMPRKSYGLIVHGLLRKWSQPGTELDPARCSLESSSFKF